MADSSAPKFPVRPFRTPPPRSLMGSLNSSQNLSRAWALSVILALSLPIRGQNPTSPPPNQSSTREIPAAGSPPPPQPASPSALLQAFQQSAKPDWTSLYRDPVPTSFPSRAQNALILGSLYADALLAGLAEDSQQVHNLARDLMAVAKPLGLTAPPSPKDPNSTRFDRSKSLTDCADQKKWPALRLELEASEAAAEETLCLHEDRNLAELVSLGVWLRSLQILAVALVEKRDPPMESTLSENLLVQIRKILQSEPGKKAQEDATWNRLLTQTQELETLLAPPQGLPGLDLCKVLKTLSAMLGTPARRKSAPPLPCALESGEVRF